ncbi:hypothetical protein N9J07_05285, partial [Bacteroidia bacterium]|nr:hypothetical protein [Bacteroidia bacterium]
GTAWYCYEKSFDWIPLDLKRVNEIIALNKKGKTPPTLSDTALGAEVAFKTLEYKDDLLGDTDLTRMDDKNRRGGNRNKGKGGKPRNDRNRNQPKGKGGKPRNDRNRTDKPKGDKPQSDKPRGERTGNPRKKTSNRKPNPNRKPQGDKKGPSPENIG